MSLALTPLWKRVLDRRAEERSGVQWRRRIAGSKYAHAFVRGEWLCGYGKNRAALGVPCELTPKGMPFGAVCSVCSSTALGMARGSHV
ncbi:MAG: hypothetical protein M3O50_18310 [Myxococcota bacterium]|nr:hypothetical protein [Myxococcota bacterium]